MSNTRIPDDLEAMWLAGPSDRRIIDLTADDGPSNGGGEACPWPTPTRLDHAARVVMLGLLGALDGGQLTVDDWVGRRRIGEWAVDPHGRSPLHATVRVHHPGTYRRIVTDRSAGIGESYADGWWDTDDLTTALRVMSRAVRHADRYVRGMGRFTGPISDRFRSLRTASRKRDRTNIRLHYDLGNEFFAELLDDTMAYSCGVFPSADAPLEQASVEKFDRLCHMVGLQPGQRLLEIGTGWGGFALHAARHYDCHVTTTTISDEQYRHSVDRVRAEGLTDRISVLPSHYRDVKGRFDAIVAIEMIEAVDWREYEAFFAACRRQLLPTGRLALQAIVVPGSRFDIDKRKDDFIKKAIFPGGCLASIEALLRAASSAADLRLVQLDDIGVHYAETLRRWKTNLDDMGPSLPSVGDNERFRRLWRFYLTYCEAGFEEREISVVQMALAGPGWRPQLP